jgi:hypothetical protein
MTERQQRIVVGMACLYAVAMLSAGALRLWSRPLDSDDRVHYLPNIQRFAAVFPRVLLHYAMPMPPAALYLQGLIYRATGGSVAATRALATICSIATVLMVIAHVGRSGRFARTLLFLAMVGSSSWFPAFGFSLKHYAVETFFLVAGWILWERRHESWHFAAGATVLFALSVLCVQMAAAFLLMLLFEERKSPRYAALLLLPLALLGVLVVYWRGSQPPEFWNVPHRTWLGIHPIQLLVAGFVLGTSLVPLIDGWWKRAVFFLAATPFIGWMFYRAEILVHRAPGDARMFYEMTGSAFLLIRALVRSNYPLVVICVSIVCAVGISWPAQVLSLRRHELTMAGIYTAIYCAMMLLVPFYFERYYALLVMMSWVLLSRMIVQSRSALVALYQCAFVIAAFLHALRSPVLG